MDLEFITVKNIESLLLNVKHVVEKICTYLSL